MKKFWPMVVILLIIASGLLYFENRDFGQAGISFSDLETECRIGPETADITLMEDRSLAFNGNYPESNTRSELDYRYRKSSDRIILDVRSESPGPPETFVDDCLASVKYEARTQPIEPGRYVVDVQHNGETERKVVIRID